MKKIHLIVLLAAMPFYLLAQDPSIILTTQRPPELEVSTYRQVAIGQITGPLGSPTELSLDLTDALSSRLFAAQTLEVVDKNTLDKILGDQKYKDLQVIDDATTRQLNKKLGNAILITGRMQGNTLEQKLIYEDQGVVVNGCTKKYFYQVKGNVSIQLKIFDLKSGKLIYNEPVIIEVDKQTKEDCSIPNKLDVPAITRQATKELGEQVARLIVPYEVKTVLQFSDPGLFKSPFKRLREAVGFLQMKNYEPALAIFKEYTESKDVKGKHLPLAYFNYALGLIYAGKYEEAKPMLEKAMTGGSAYIKTVNELTALIEKEQQAARKVARLAEERQKMEQAAIANPEVPKESDKPAPKQSGSSKTPAKVKTKS